MPEESPNAADANTTIDVNVTAGAVQDSGQVTGVQVGSIHGSVTIVAASGAADQEAARRVALAALRQPSIALRLFEPQTIYIPGGPFLMGSPPREGAPDHESPQHEVDLAEYRIGKFPVMNCEYEVFLRETKRLASAEMRWDGQAPFKGDEQRPVTGVTWCDAIAYCQWLSDKTGRHYTLPSEALWEKAARGGDGRLYPWGDWSEGRCNQGRSELAAVDAYPAQSVYGCHDMVGNAPEWTSTIWGSDVLEPRYRYPWADDGRDDLGANSQVRRIVRGGAALDPPEKLRCAARTSTLPLQPGPFGKRHGFRVILALGGGSPAAPFCESEG
jgi:iron(II)-dependent oxidoreductase